MHKLLISRKLDTQSEGLETASTERAVTAVDPAARAGARAGAGTAARAGAKAGAVAKAGAAARAVARAEPTDPGRVVSSEPQLQLLKK